METIKTFQNDASHTSNKVVWTGRIFSILCILFLLVDAIMKVVKAAPAVEGTVQLGWSENSVQIIGIILLIFTIIYAIPRTAVLGAILITAYLGGATATMMRIGEPVFFPILFALFVWIGLGLRDEKLRSVLLGK